MRKKNKEWHQYEEFLKPSIRTGNIVLIKDLKLSTSKTHLSMPNITEQSTKPKWYWTHAQLQPLAGIYITVIHICTPKAENIPNA